LPCEWPGKTRAPFGCAGSTFCEHLAEGRFGVGGSATCCAPQDLTPWRDQHRNDCTHRRNPKVLEELFPVDVHRDCRLTDLWIRNAASHASIDEPRNGSVHLRDHRQFIHSKLRSLRRKCFGNRDPGVHVGLLPLPERNQQQVAVARECAREAMGCARQAGPVYLGESNLHAQILRPRSVGCAHRRTWRPSTALDAQGEAK